MLRFFVLVCILAVCFGEVVELTDANFEDEFNNGNWIVKFYAPWCGHCKTLAPVFDELSNSGIANVRIGSLDVTRNPVTGEKYNIKRFPTTMYKRNGVVGDYDGPRTLEAFVSFANRMNDPSYITIDSVSELNGLYAANENVAFVLVYNVDSELTESVKSISDTFKEVASELHSHAAFALMPVSSSELVVGKAGYSIYKMELDRSPMLMPESIKSVKELSDFVEFNNYPSINKFDNHNFKRLSHLNKTMIMAIVDYSKEENSQILIRALTTAVDSFPPEERVGFVFGHVDGVRWRPFIKEHNAAVSDILVVDTNNDMHANFPVSSSTSNIAGFISDIISSAIEQKLDLKPTVAPGLWQKIQYRIRDSAPYSYFILALPFVLLTVSFFASYPVDEKLKKH